MNKFLHSIEIGIPKLLVKTKSGQHLTAGEYAFRAIFDSLHANGLGHISVLKRHEGELLFCRCKANYYYLITFDKNEFKKRFAKK